MFFFCWWAPQDHVLFLPGPAGGSLQRPSLVRAVFRRRKLTVRMVWRPKGAQTLRSLQFGDPKASKPYAHRSLEIRSRPNLTPTVVWRTQGARKLCPAGKPTKTKGFFLLGLARLFSFFQARQAAPFSAQTLCALCLNDSRRPNLTLTTIWRPQGVQTLCTL